MSRISTNQVFSQTQSHISTAKEREHISAEKASSLKELTRPSQAPASYVIAADMKDDLAIRETIAKNATMANHVLAAQENILTQSQDIVQKVHELAIQASSTTNRDVAKHVLPEVEGLFNNLIQAVNSKFGNRTLLSGFKSDKPAFDPQGNFIGDNERMEMEIDRGQKIDINLSGGQVILGEGVKEGVNIPQSLQTLIEGLRTNNVEMVRSTLGDLNRATEQLSTGRTQVAGRQLEIQRALETHSLNGTQRKEAISQIEEADAVKAFSDLARDQTVLRAAMETSRKILSEVPTDILFKG